VTDYAADVSALVRQLAAPPVVMSWSMGGLATLIPAALAWMEKTASR